MTIASMVVCLYILNLLPIDFFTLKSNPNPTVVLVFCKGKEILPTYYMLNGYHGIPLEMKYTII